MTTNEVIMYTIGIILGFMAGYSLYNNQSITTNKKIIPTIAIVTTNNVSDTTYIYNAK